MHPFILRAALAWFMTAPVAAWGQTAILQLHIVEGEGAVFAASSRAVKPVTVRVTDHAGAPIAGATVSFRLPEEGVTGVFQNGSKTDVAMSGPDGRAVAPNIAWGPLAGPARIRVTAALGEARAGLLAPVHVSAAGGNVVVAGASAAAAAPASPAMEPRQQRFDPAPAPRLKSKRRWVKWLIVAAGGAAAGAVIISARTRAGGGATAGPAVAGSTITIGQPTITVGRTP